MRVIYVILLVVVVSSCEKGIIFPVELSPKTIGGNLTDYYLPFDGNDTLVYVDSLSNTLVVYSLGYYNYFETVENTYRNEFGPSLFGEKTIQDMENIKLLFSNLDSSIKFEYHLFTKIWNTYDDEPEFEAHVLFNFQSQLEEIDFFLNYPNQSREYPAWDAEIDYLFKNDTIRVFSIKEHKREIIFAEGLPILQFEDENWRTWKLYLW